MPLDYSGQNLRGRSFKGQDLTGTNFSGADIRGANFSKAILKGANFKGAKAGQPGYWVLLLALFSSFLAILSAFTAGLTTVFNQSLLNPDPIVHIITSVVVLIVPFIVTTTKGFPLSLISIAFSLATSTLLVIFLAVSGHVYTALSVIFTAIGTLTGATTVAATIAGVSTVAGTIIATIVSIASVIASLAGTICGISVVLKTAGVVAKIELAADLAVAIMVLIGAIQGVYIGWQILAFSPKYSLIYPIAINFATIGGTSFYNADLTDANFTGATLKTTDFRKANLTHTCFYEVKNLEFARVGDSILSNPVILNLLVTGNGRRKSYTGTNLKGANLICADLKDADISEATFKGACLEWSNLTLAQAVGTDFTQAQMTGACVEAWNIESTTKLDNVDCRFIYLLENPKLGTDDRERRPSSGEFQPGEFTKLFEEVVNTVDLIFRNGIDWKAFVAAFKKVQVQNENTELAIQSIENKGDGVVVVKVAASVDAHKEKIHNDFTQNYQLALQAVEEKYKAQLQAKDEQIVIYRQQSADMKEIVSLLANKPINVQVDNKVENKNMPNGNDSSRKFENSGTLNNSGQINLGEISGTVTNTINQLTPSPEQDKPGIKELWFFRYFYGE
ncbi:pentapeptide repeat-containing protein [Nostoc spongiaeforme FACHB-130]|uniref:Pentapeptide repeat-containing protein n=1 Tax=Nostoc spongiaeforme FACHB-130 TaxID=1357510 RepID=A0ABR8G0D5_9NOSO|nr:pentapeptide repeat-containing protein [Nostoc spongiaeforme]MBD2596678.1 pentapeptide repeat-containing protein [Nostoc spongiaeforme FACHB-130]